MVKKFGGTSVGTLERIDSVARRIIQDQTTQIPVIVVSAMSGETNRLINLANQVYPGYRGNSYDMLLASGEQVSVALLSMAIQRAGGKVKPFLAHQLGIFTDSVFSKARITRIETDKLKNILNKGIIPVIAGFQGIDKENNITTLGRGGTDTSAVALSCALNTKECEIYTDVSHVYTADPRLVPNAKKVTKISYEEMMEMANLGSKILHARSVELAAKYKIKIHVRSTFEKINGTWVIPKEDYMEESIVTAVTQDTGTSVIKLFPLPLGVDVLAKIFDTLANNNIVVDIITQSYRDDKQRVAFSISKEDTSLAKDVIKKILPSTQIETMQDIAKVSVVGVGMSTHSGVAAKFFQTLSKSNIPIHLVTTSEIKISAVVDLNQLELTVNSLHKAFKLF